MYRLHANIHIKEHPEFGQRVVRLVFSLLVVAFTLTEEVRAGGQSLPSDPTFKALRIDGQITVGRLVGIGPGIISLAPQDGPTHDLPLRSLVSLAREPRSSPPPMDGSHILFPEGDRLMRVVVGASSETHLQIQSFALGKISIPLDSILGIMLSSPIEGEIFDRLWTRIRSEPRTTEIIWLVNGDRMAGSFLGIDDRSIKFQVENRPMEIDRTGVSMLEFDPSLVNYPRPEADYLEVTALDGSRIGLRGTRLDRGQLIGDSRFGQQFRLPISDVSRIVPRTAVIDFLSEREPDAAQYIPYVGPPRPLQIDRTVEGHPFLLGGQSYDRGLGTQSRTLLAYRLKAGDLRFQAMVGVDERAGSLGSVAFRVLLDGNPRFATPSLTANDLPREIDIDISGGKLLFLVTEFGDRGDVRDIADWIDARIIRRIKP